MDTVTVSPKFRVVIPRRVREALGLKPGQKLQVFLHDNRIELLPIRPIEEYRGFLRGIDTTIEREEDVAEIEQIALDRSHFTNYGE